MNSPVSPETKIGPLLDAHPELEQTLFALSPEFRRLQNPILRRTVARVATVGQAAKIAGLPVPELVRALRTALGQAHAEVPPTTEEVEPTQPPWVEMSAPAFYLDADATLARGGTPVGEMIGLLVKAQPGDVVALTAAFYPAPLVDAVRAKGYKAFAREADSGWEVLVRVP